MVDNPRNSQFIGSCSAGAFRISSDNTTGVGVGNGAIPAALVGAGGSGVGVKSGIPGRAGRLSRAVLYQI